MSRMKRKCFLLQIGGAGLVALLAACGSRPGPPATAAVPAPPVVVTAPVVLQELYRETRLPGELTPYQEVALYPKVQGFVEWIGVDRGSVVRRGQPLARLRAPELAAQRSEAEAKARAARAQRIESEARVQALRAQGLEAEARLAGDEATYNRLKAASATPGVVAGHDVEMALKTLEAGRARVRLWEESGKAAQSQVQALAENEKAAGEAAHSVAGIASYLSVTAPFDGVITERNAHEGSLVGPPGGTGSTPMLRLQQVARLRLQVAVPEVEVSGIAAGATVSFTVPAFPGETFSGTTRRVGRALDPRTRTMPVEIDVDNASGQLAPGMFPEVLWPFRRPRPTLFVPASAVATTTERTFVVRIKNDVAEWVDVKRGVAKGDLTEVFGSLAAGDLVVVRGTDELRAGTRVVAKPAASAGAAPR